MSLGGGAELRQGSQADATLARRPQAIRRLPSFSVAKLSEAEESQIPETGRAPICYRKDVLQIVESTKSFDEFGRGYHRNDNGTKKADWFVSPSPATCNTAVPLLVCK